MSTENLQRSPEKRKSIMIKETSHVPRKPIICKDKIYLDIYPQLNQQIQSGEAQEVYYFQTKKSSSSITIPKMKLDSENRINLKLKKIKT